MRMSSLTSLCIIASRCDRLQPDRLHIRIGQGAPLADHPLDRVCEIMDHTLLSRDRLRLLLGRGARPRVERLEPVKLRDELCFGLVAHFASSDVRALSISGIAG